MDMGKLYGLVEEVARLREIEAAAREAYEFLTRASFDFSNGNTAQGVDEGEVIGWKAHNEVCSKLAALLDKGD
jgi:hypothetical protein